MQIEAVTTPVLRPTVGGVAQDQENRPGPGPLRDRATISEQGRRSLHQSNEHELSEEEQEQVRELAKRDREVRAHEQAHAAAAGSLASGGPVYEYQVGPDGKRYAIGGHVDIQLRQGRTPEETARLAKQAQAAAAAPADPSGQDRAVAAKAAAMAAEAQRETRSAALEDGSGAAMGFFSSEPPADATGRLLDRIA